MKWTIVFLIFIAFTTSSSTCNRTMGTSSAGKCFKGRLEIKGICMNYVIKVLDGDLATLNVEKTWTDEQTGKSYQNVFGLSTPCNFPDLKEGEEFYFTIATTENNDCITCKAYRPTPQKKNNISVVKEPCK